MGKRMRSGPRVPSLDLLNCISDSACARISINDIPDHSEPRANALGNYKSPTAATSGTLFFACISITNSLTVSGCTYTVTKLATSLKGVVTNQLHLIASLHG